jgi:hypothetical protein
MTIGNLLLDAAVCRLCIPARLGPPWPLLIGRLLLTWQPSSNETPPLSPPSNEDPLPPLALSVERLRAR